LLHPCRSAKCVRPAPRSARTPKRMTASQPAEQGAWNYSSSLKDFHGTPKGCKPNYTHPIHYPQTDGCEAKIAPVLPDWQCNSGLSQKAGTATSDRALAEQGADARHLDFQGKAPAKCKKASQLCNAWPASCKPTPFGHPRPARRHPCCSHGLSLALGRGVFATALPRSRLRRGCLAHTVRPCALVLLLRQKPWSGMPPEAVVPGASEHRGLVQCGVPVRRQKLHVDVRRAVHLRAFGDL